MNAYSILHNYDNQPLYSPDFNFINTALSYKQQKLDTNRAKLQNLYDQYSMLDVHNDVDKEYIEERLKSVRDITNRYASMDLSDDNFASSLMSNVHQVVDEKVVNAVISTRIIQAEDAEWKKHKGTDKYSDLNRSYVLAKSDRRNYENIKEAGAMYKGGAGFKEYVDVGKIFMENIPKLEKVLGAKWITNGNKEGHFETLETHEGIPKEKIAAVFETMLDEKANEQLRINAWGTYDKLPDNVIKEDWDNFYQSDKDKLQNDIKNLELVIANPKYKADAPKYQERLEQTKEKLNSLEEYSFENIAQTNGRDVAINTLYKAKFKNQILEAYSSDNITDIKINEAQKESLYYDLKLRSEARADAEFNLKEKKYNLEIAKLELEAKKGDPAYGNRVTTDQEGVESNFTKEYFENDRIAKGNMVELLKKNGISDTEAQKIMQSPEFIGQLKNLAGKKYLEVGGKKIDIVANNATLTNFVNAYVVESGTDKFIKGRTQGIIGDVQKIIANAPDINIYKELPNFNFQVKNGKYVYTEYKQGSHNYAYLIKQKQKGTLTKDQENTLNLYTALHLYNDPNIAPEDSEVTKTYINGLLSNLDPSVAKNISLEISNKGGKRLKNSHTVIPTTLDPKNFRDLWITNFDKADVNKGTAFGRWVEHNVAAALATTGFDPLVGIVDKKSSAEDWAKVYSKKEGIGIDRLIKDQFKEINKEIGRAQSVTSYLPEVREVIYSPESKEYDKILNAAGVTDTKYNRKVKLVPVLQGNTPTGDYKIEYEQKSTETGKTSQWVSAPTKTINKDELRRQGIATSDFNRNNKFDARRPEYAASLDLGNNVYDKDKLTSFAMSPNPKRRNRYVILTNNVKEDYVARAADLGDNYKKEMQRLLNSFSNGEYNFKLNPKQDNTYYLDIYKGDKRFESVPTQEQNLDEKVPMLLQDPRTYIEYGFTNFLDKKLEEMTRHRIENY